MFDRALTRILLLELIFFYLYRTINKSSQLYLPPVVWERELPRGTDIAGGGEQLYLPPVVWERELPPATDIAGGGEE